MAVNLVVALLVIAASWVAIARALAAAERRPDPAQTAAARLAAKTAPWRAQPLNHP